MIISKTKYSATREEIKLAFQKNGISDIAEIATLGGGEFNAAFKVSSSDGKKYVIKLAPPDDAPVLTYEKDMMRSEVFWYNQLHEKSSVRVPQIFAYDATKEVIPTSYFIMEFVSGRPLYEFYGDEALWPILQEKKIELITKLHRIHNDGFGYIQNGLYGNWYEAIKAMTRNLLADGRRIGHPNANGERLYELIDKYAETLKHVTCSLTSFDLWDPNLLYDRETDTLTLIDPERGFWGDPIGDFITFPPNHKVPFSEKRDIVAAYNRTAERTMSGNQEEQIRYAILIAYLALIEDIEKNYRYTPEHENFIRNTADAKDMFDVAFEVLEG